ncbi:MAG: type II toxin-antitoxin system PemK/MazF family toxin [Pirellulales bacterium]|nr:type II toxin-antitoxin system PemK/MazF family toxin [Pirellulales bacterium]
MNPGDVVLIPLQQAAGGAPKLRPALVLSRLPGAFQNVLICGISTRLRDLVDDWDELVRTADQDFRPSGLHHESAIRLSYLYAADSREIVGTIGQIDSAGLKRLLTRLSDHLRK